MGTRHCRIMVAALACLLALLMAACGTPAAESAPLVDFDPVPIQSDNPPVPTVQPPETQPPSGETYTAPPPAPSEELPSPSSPPVASLPPDEETTLTYLLGEEELSVPAVRHHSLVGYAITYDTALFSLMPFEEGDTYWNGDGNYLTFTLIYELTAAEVLDGLRLQENIAMEPELVSVGEQQFTAFTLYLTAPNGFYRQFWVLELERDILLAELSYDTVCDNAPQLRAALTASLNTLTLF